MVGILVAVVVMIGLVISARTRQSGKNREFVQYWISTLGFWLLYSRCSLPEVVLSESSHACEQHSIQIPRCPSPSKFYNESCIIWRTVGASDQHLRYSFNFLAFVMY